MNLGGMRGWSVKAAEAACGDSRSGGRSILPELRGIVLPRECGGTRLHSPVSARARASRCSGLLPSATNSGYALRSSSSIRDANVKLLRRISVPQRHRSTG